MRMRMRMIESQFHLLFKKQVIFLGCKENFFRGILQEFRLMMIKPKKYGRVKQDMLHSYR